MTMTSAERARRRAENAEHDRQRIEHLVLGRARPPVEIGPKPKGVSKQEWRATKADLRTRGQKLLPGIEEAVDLRERYGHRKGTPETHGQFERANRPSGAIARLFRSGLLNADQLSASHEIAAKVRAINAGVPVKTASWETRINGGGGGPPADVKLLGRTLDELDLEWWCASVRGSAEACIAVIAHDVGLTIVAGRYGMSMPRARQMLADALTLWSDRFGRGTIAAS